MTDVQAPQIFFMARLHTKDARQWRAKTPGLVKEADRREDKYQPRKHICLDTSGIMIPAVRCFDLFS